MRTRAPMLCHYDNLSITRNTLTHTPKKKKRRGEKTAVIIETKKGNIGHKATDCHIAHRVQQLRCGVVMTTAATISNEKKRRIHPVKMCAHTLTHISRLYEKAYCSTHEHAY